MLAFYLCTVFSCEAHVYVLGTQRCLSSLSDSCQAFHLLNFSSGSGTSHSKSSAASSLSVASLWLWLGPENPRGRKHFPTWRGHHGKLTAWWCLLRRRWICHLPSPTGDPGCVELVQPFCLGPHFSQMQHSLQMEKLQDYLAVGGKLVESEVWLSQGLLCSAQQVYGFSISHHGTKAVVHIELAFHKINCV